jgi:hypothetical protein
VATATLITLMIWPPVQHVVTRTAGVDPWSFFGFAMYAVPNLRVTVRAARLDSIEPGTEPDWNAISVGSYRTLREFGERRARFGSFASPDDAARKLFAAQPDLPGIVIRIQRWVIARDSTRLESHDIDLVYAPPGRRVDRTAEP